MDKLSDNSFKRPEFSVTDILYRSLAVLFQNPVVFFGLALTAVLISTAVAYLPGDPRLTGQLSQLLYTLFTRVIQGCIAFAVYQALSGNVVSLGASLSKGLPRAGTIIGLTLVVSIVTFVGFLALIIPGLIITCAWLVAVPVCVIEKRGVSDSLKRSAELTKGYRFHILGLFILGLLITMALAAALAYLAIMVSGSQWAVGLAFFLGKVFGVALLDVIISIIYADLKAVKEDTAIDSLANVFD